MGLPIQLRKPGNYSHFERDASLALYAKAQKKKCLVGFADGEFECSLSLKHFEEYVTPTGKFFRAHDSWVLRWDAIIDHRWLIAILKNGKYIPLSRKMYDDVKLYVQNLFKG